MGKGSTPSNGGKENFLLKAFIAGNSCAVVAALLNPFDVAKIRLQNQSSSLRYTGMINAIVTIGKEEGLRGLSAGVTASMIREILYSSVRIGGYEPIRKALSTPDSNPADASPIIKLFSALISGGVGAAIVNPFDLIKTRFQSILPGEVSPYRHTFHALAAIYRRETIAGLYKGWTVTSSRAAVLTSSQLGSYDSIKHNLLMNLFGMEDGIKLHLVASMCAGLITTTATIPCNMIMLVYVHIGSCCDRFSCVPL